MFFKKMKLEAIPVNVKYRETFVYDDIFPQKSAKLYTADTSL